MSLAFRAHWLNARACSRQQRTATRRIPASFSGPARANASSSANKPPSSGRRSFPPSEAGRINAPPSIGRQDDGLSRYPNLRSPGGILRSLDYAGTVTFAVTGSLTAAQSGLDVFGCCVVSHSTGIQIAMGCMQPPYLTPYQTNPLWKSINPCCIFFCRLQQSQVSAGEPFEMPCSFRDALFGLWRRSTSG